MKINRNVFWKSYPHYFGTPKQSQVDAINYLLERFDSSNLFDRLSKIAYALATIRTETAFSFEPVREGFYMKTSSIGQITNLYNYYRKYNPYAVKGIFPYGIDEKNYVGRGYVQCTFNYNYAKFQKIVKYNYNVDIVENPQSVLNRDVSFLIMELGMNQREYSFTGKVLSDYFNDNTDNYSLEKRFIGYRNFLGRIITPRQIINGTNAYQTIGSDAIKFYECLEFEE